MVEESNCNHNYIWSSVQYGNYIYIDTCKNPISGIYKKSLIVFIDINFFRYIDLYRTIKVLNRMMAGGLICIFWINIRQLLSIMRC